MDGYVATPETRRSRSPGVVPRSAVPVIAELAAGHAHPVDGEALWPALMAGRWSVLGVFTVAGARYMVAHENPDATAADRALSPREQRIVEHALAGRSGKWIGLELEVSEATATRGLGAALGKLGITNIASLAGVRTASFAVVVRVTAGVALAVARMTPAAVSLASLSRAERSITTDLLNGKPRAAIARERGTSPRTVATQITSIYQKLKVSSRRELVARLMCSSDTDAMSPRSWSA